MPLPLRSRLSSSWADEVRMKSTLSLVYLGSHLVLARRYQKIGLQRAQRTVRNQQCLTTLAVSGMIWFAAYILGLMISLRPKEGDPSPKDSINGFKLFEQAGFAGPLSSLLV